MTRAPRPIAQEKNCRLSNDRRHMHAAEETTLYDLATDWLAVKASLYGSSSSFLSNTSTSTWSECAGNCSSKPPCFVFNWCSNPFGCCNVTAGCQADDLQSYGTCLLKAQATVSPVYSDSLPDLVYDSSIAQGWDAPGNRRQGISSSAHAFDSGAPLPRETAINL